MYRYDRDGREISGYFTNEEIKDNFANRGPDEPYSHEEVATVWHMLNSPIERTHTIPSARYGKGRPTTVTSTTYDPLKDSELLKQVVKEGGDHFWFDTPDKHNEVKAVYDYMKEREEGRGEPTSVLEAPKPKPTAPTEHPEEVLAAKAGIDDYRASMEDGSFFKQILGPRASGDPDKSWSELQDQDEEFKNPETFIVDRGRDKAGGSYLDNYLLTEKQALKEELLKELLA